MKINYIFIAGVTIGIIIGSVTTVCANQSIQAILNDQIKISLNGEFQTFKDEITGDIQYPITYDNRTYLPLRNVASLSGLTVDYDSSTNTAILKEKSGEETKSSRMETQKETIIRFVKEFNDNYPDYIISKVYWSYASYIRYMRNGMFIDVYYDNGKIKAIVTENTYVDYKDGVRKDFSRQVPTDYKDFIYYLGKMSNKNLSKKEIDRIYDDLEEGKYGSSILSKTVNIDDVVYTYWNQSSFFNTEIEFDFEAILVDI